MTNLSITNRCNRQCDYCFAREPLQGKRADAPTAHMSLAVYERSLDFLARSGTQEVRLLGGEPTLHPQFLQFVDRALARGLRLLIFTGGLVGAKILQRLEDLDPNQVSVLVNVVPPEAENAALLKRQVALYRRLGQRIILGINIASPATPLDDVLELIDRYRLSRHIRLGLTQPVWGGTNRHLHPRHYPEVGRRVAAFGLKASRRNVNIEWDCGWVPCMFPDEAWSALGISAGAVGLRCNPILDVMPDGRVIACYPLATLVREWLPNDRDAAWLRARFARKLATISAFHLSKQCASCEWRARAACTGGCKAAALRRMRHADFAGSIAPDSSPGAEDGPLGPTRPASGQTS